MPEENIITQECQDFCFRLWRDKMGWDKDFIFMLLILSYNKLNDFNPHGHVSDTNDQIDGNLLFIIRCVTQFYLTKAFKAMKIDLSNPNVAENLSEGNIGTPGRMAKIMVGSNLNDDRELGSGRWAKKPRMAAFPNENGSSIPITKKIDIISNCSHHFIPFSSIARPDSYAIISYIPNDFVIGISKLQRIANWLSLRFWLQEDLTKALYDEISKVSKTESVYVKLNEMTHGCESLEAQKLKMDRLQPNIMVGNSKLSQN